MKLPYVHARCLEESNHTLWHAIHQSEYTPLLPRVQAWYAVHAPLLRMAAAQQVVWSRVLSDMGPLGSTETGGQNPISGTDASGDGDSQKQTLDALIRDVARSYRLKCASEQVSPLTTPTVDPEKPKRAARSSLMQVLKEFKLWLQGLKYPS